MPREEPGGFLSTSKRQFHPCAATIAPLSSEPSNFGGEIANLRGTIVESRFAASKHNVHVLSPLPSYLLALEPLPFLLGRKKSLDRLFVPACTSACFKRCAAAEAVVPAPAISLQGTIRPFDRQQTPQAFYRGPQSRIHESPWTPSQMPPASPLPLQIPISRPSPQALGS